MDVTPKNVFDFTIKTDVVNFNLTNIPGRDQEEALKGLRESFLDALKQIEDKLSQKAFAPGGTRTTGKSYNVSGSPVST